MSYESERLSEAKALWDEAVKACEKLELIDESILRSIAKQRVQMPLLAFGKTARNWKGANASKYLQDLGLGSGLPVNADRPNDILKTYILRYVEQVYSLKEGDEPVLKIPEFSEGKIDHGVQDYIISEANIRWLQKLNAYHLPDLNEDTAGRWADQIASDMHDDVDFYGGLEEQEIDGEVQMLKTGYPPEINSQISKNYNKTIRRKRERARSRAAKTAEHNSAIEGMEEYWVKFYEDKARKTTWVQDITPQAVREKIGEVLRGILIDIP